MGGGLVLNQACADILKQFNMGENSLTPLQIFDLETQKLMSDEVFYFLNICERRKFLYEPENNVLLSVYARFEHGLMYKMEKSGGDAIVKNKALDCDVDLWHDQQLFLSIFMSDRLHNALDEAGFREAWRPLSCCSVFK